MQNRNIQLFFFGLIFIFFKLKKFQLDLQLQDESGGDLSSFVTNGEWALLGKNTNIFLVDLVIILRETEKNTKQIILSISLLNKNRTVYKTEIMKSTYGAKSIKFN